LVKRPEDWRWSSYNNYSLDPPTVERCPIRIRYVRLPEQYRGRGESGKAHGLPAQAGQKNTDRGYPLARLADVR
jgi:hypothetical protein